MKLVRDAVAAGILNDLVTMLLLFVVDCLFSPKCG